MSYLVVSCSLNPESRSRLLAASIKKNIESKAENVEFLDLAENQIPFCDGAGAYSDPITVELVAAISSAKGIILCVPVYNYDVNAAAKNLIELTGPSWMGKVVGFACAAGGHGSYMSVMGVANSLMLDFRCHILPRFVYALGDAFQGDSITDPTVTERIEELSNEMVRVTGALSTEQ
ncbi:MAG TPA: NADPH-dependent oxidoreductase [Verrucomicrobia bacterium]|nr:NAD(P)H-dependent oxidoreductase [Verrucomicrobiales bacterium]HIG85344.1 NADPH-dependent oxidoreductase [Verrucomicrobiales bacterium]HIL53994.1 NADPH-dependent oxidoreductase [Verrucomicrobiota bacterium]